MYLLAGSDEMIETVEHFALFASDLDAQALADRINAARDADRAWNPAHWLWEPSRCSAFAFMHSKPTAVRETVARPAVRSRTWID